MPPHFTGKKFPAKRLAAYIMTSKEIGNFSQHFYRLHLEVGRLVRRIKNGKIAI